MNIEQNSNLQNKIEGIIADSSEIPKLSDDLSCDRATSIGLRHLTQSQEEIHDDVQTNDKFDQKAKRLQFPDICKQDESTDFISKMHMSSIEESQAMDASEMIKQLSIKHEESTEIPVQPEQLNMIEITELFKKKGSLLEQQKLNQQTQLPPLDIYKPKVNVSHECISYGLNMYFKKPHPFSDDPDQGGGDLAPHQSYSSQPWGVMGCPPKLQKNLTDYVVQNLKEVVYCRYGLDYLKSFPRCDDLAIGSYKINLDYLIFQKQKQNIDADNK